MANDPPDALREEIERRMIARAIEDITESGGIISTVDAIAIALEVASEQRHAFDELAECGEQRIATAEAALAKMREKWGHECGSQVGGLMHDTACGHDSSHNGENCSKCYASAASAGKVAIEAARREGAAEAWREATTIAGRADCTDGGFYGQPCLCNRCSLVRVFEQRAPEVKK